MGTIDFLWPVGPKFVRIRFSQRTGELAFVRSRRFELEPLTDDHKRQLLDHMKSNKEYYPEIILNSVVPILAQ